jgi:hypothetical protein
MQRMGVVCACSHKLLELMHISLNGRFMVQPNLFAAYAEPIMAQYFGHFVQSLA